MFGRRAQDVGVPRPTESIITGPQTVSSSARSSGTSSRRPPGPKAGCTPPAARRDRPHGEGSTRIGRRAPARRRRRRRRPPPALRVGRRQDDPALPGGCERGAGARPIAARRDRGKRLCLAPGSHEHVLGDVMQPGPARGARPRSERRGPPALRRRRCRIGTSCSASSPTTTIVAAPSISRYVTPLGTGRGQHLGRAAVRRPTVVQVVGPQHGTRELRQCVRVLVEQAPARDHADARAVARVGDRRQRLAERGRLQTAIAHERCRDPAARVVVVEREPALVADPGVVDLGVLARQHPHDLAAPLVDAHGAPGAAVTADGVDTREVERSRDEPVGRGGQRPDRADLHDVARERRSQVLAGGDRDPLARPPRRTARGTGRR